MKLERVQSEAPLLTESAEIQRNVSPPIITVFFISIPAMQISCFINFLSVWHSLLRSCLVLCNACTIPTGNHLPCPTKSSQGAPKLPQWEPSAVCNICRFLFSLHAFVLPLSQCFWNLSITTTMIFLLTPGLINTSTTTPTSSENASCSRSTIILDLLHWLPFE